MNQWTWIQIFHRGESPQTIPLQIGNTQQAHGLMPIGLPGGEILMDGPTTTCWASSSMHLIAPHVGHMGPIMESHLTENTSFIDVVHRRDSEFVSFTMYCDTISDKECAQEDAAHYCASSDKFEAE